MTTRSDGNEYCQAQGRNLKMSRTEPIIEARLYIEAIVDRLT